MQELHRLLSPTSGWNHSQMIYLDVSHMISSVADGAFEIITFSSVLVFLLFAKLHKYISI